MHSQKREGKCDVIYYMKRKVEMEMCIFSIYSDKFTVKNYTQENAYSTQIIFLFPSDVSAEPQVKH